MKDGLSVWKSGRGQMQTERSSPTTYPGGGPTGKPKGKVGGASKGKYSLKGSKPV